jgi:hypothetical protein
MKNTLLITALSLALATPAFASNDINTNTGNGNVINTGPVNNGPVNTGPNVGGVITNTAKAAADATAKADAGAVAVADGGKGGNATTGPVTASAPTNIYTKVPRQAPAPASSFGAVSVSTFSCANAVGGSLTAPVGGIAFNSSQTDRNCQRILLSREIRLHGSKYEDASVGLLCRDEELREEMAKNGTPCPGSHAQLAPGAGLTESRAGGASLKPHGDVRAIDRN